MNTTENNKLIAGFMKLKRGIYPSRLGKGYWETTIGDVEVAEANRLPYNTSWDWLMPVVEKIEVLGYSFEKNYQPIDKDWQCLIVKGYDILFQEFDEDSLKATYKAVVEFIKWYNENYKE